MNAVGHEQEFKEPLNPLNHHLITISLAFLWTLVPSTAGAIEVLQLVVENLYLSRPEEADDRMKKPTGKTGSCTTQTSILDDFRWFCCTLATQGWFASSPSHIEGEHTWTYNWFLIQFNWEKHQNGDIEHIKEGFDIPVKRQKLEYRLQKNLDFGQIRVHRSHRSPDNRKPPRKARRSSWGGSSRGKFRRFPPRFPNFPPEEAIWQCVKTLYPWWTSK